MTFSSPPPSPKSHAKAPHANKKHDGGVNNPSSSALSSFDFIRGILHHQRRVVFAFVFVLFSPRLFSSSSSSNRVSVSYSDQKKTISLIADVYLAKLSLLKRSSSMRNENDWEKHTKERILYIQYFQTTTKPLSFFFFFRWTFFFPLCHYSLRVTSRAEYTHTQTHYRPPSGKRRRDLSSCCSHLSLS